MSSLDCLRRCLLWKNCLTVLICTVYINLIRPSLPMRNVRISNSVRLPVGPVPMGLLFCVLSLIARLYRMLWCSFQPTIWRLTMLVCHYRCCSCSRRASKLLMISRHLFCILASSPKLFGQAFMAVGTLQLTIGGRLYMQPWLCAKRGSRCRGSRLIGKHTAQSTSYSEFPNPDASMIPHALCSRYGLLATFWIC